MPAEHLRCHTLCVEASAPNKVPSQLRTELVALIGKRLRHKAAALESESAEAIAKQKKTTGPDAAALRNQLTLVRCLCTHTHPRQHTLRP